MVAYCPLPRHRHRVAWKVAVGVLVLAGCGGDGTGEGRSATVVEPDDALPELDGSPDDVSAAEEADDDSPDDVGVVEDVANVVRDAVNVVQDSVSVVEDDVSDFEFSGGLTVSSLNLISAGDGDGEELLLPPRFEVGQSATTELIVRSDSSVGSDSDNSDFGSESVIVMTEEVTDVTDGVVTIESWIESAESTEPPEHFDLDMYIGDVLVSRYSETGVQIGPVEMATGVPVPDVFTDLFVSSDMPMFPTEPLTLGARWSLSSDFEIGGIPATMAMETFYELVELTDDWYVLDITVETSFDPQFGGLDVDSSFQGAGTTSGSRHNPLLANASFEQTTTMTMTYGSEDIEFTSRMVFERRAS